MRSFSESHKRLAAKLHIGKFACAWPTYTSSHSALCVAQRVQNNRGSFSLRPCGKAAVAVELGYTVVWPWLSLDYKVHPRVIWNLFKMSYTAFDSVVLSFFGRKEEEQTEEQALEEQQSAHCTKRRWSGTCSTVTYLCQFSRLHSDFTHTHTLISNMILGFSHYHLNLIQWDACPSWPYHNCF